MEDDFFGSSYRGSKQFSQQEIKTANATGFTAAADDFMERGIDLNEALIRNKPATFFFRMKGDAMQGAGIFPEDILIVDRSIKVSSGKIVVAAIDGELLTRRFHQDIKGVKLLAEHPRYKAVSVGEFSNYQLWGVVTTVIHILR